MVRKWTVVAVGMAVGLGLMVLGSGAAAQLKGKERAAATKYLMRGINQPNCGGLGKVLKDGPADEKAWDTAACHASCLNEMSYLLMDDGRCPSAEWAKGAAGLREASAEVLAATEKKDAEAARASFKKVLGACKTCHDKHKKKS